MLSRVVKFFDVISNELSYAEQNVRLWSDLEQVGIALSNAIESRNEYKEKYSSQQDYLTYMRGAYMESSEHCTELSTENEELHEQIKILLAENEKLKGWETAYSSLLADYYEVFDKQRDFKRKAIFQTLALAMGTVKI